jgi:hypothetical protein
MATPAQGVTHPLPTAKSWTIRGVTVQNVMSDGTFVPWRELARETLAVDEFRISRILYGLKLKGLAGERPRHWAFSERFMVVGEGDLVLYYRRPMARKEVELRVFELPDNPSTSRGPERAQALLGAIKAAIGRTTPDLSLLGA